MVCAGVNFKDVMVRRGDPGYVDAWPVVPGLEVAGTVATVGPGVDAFQVGDRVVALTNLGGLVEARLPMQLSRARYRQMCRCGQQQRLRGR